jgi:inner membrane protein involved in colicin E2 resistance
VEEREGYRRAAEDEDGKVAEATELAFFLPAELQVTVRATPEKRRRGIYEVTFYAGFALGDRRRGLLLAPVLAAAYAFLYAALQSEDYALLIGSLGLFVILAGVMILTRKVDCYRPGVRGR